MRDHGSIGLFLGNGLFFLVGNLALSVLGLFLFCFCLVRGEQATDAQDFGWQSKGEDYFRSWFPFFFCLLGDNSVLSRYCLVQRALCIFLMFSSDPRSGIFFLFCFLPLFDWELSFFPSDFLIENFLLSLCFLLRAGFMVSWDFGSWLVERLDMIYVRVWVWPAVQG